MAQIAVIATVTAIEAGAAIYAFLNRPKQPVPVPALSQFSSSIEGTPIPFGYGTSRVAGTIVWSSGIIATRIKQHASHVFGIGFGTYYIYLYNASFAVAFGEGPGRITRVWFDSKIVFDANPNSAGTYPVQDFPAWDPTVTYQPGNEVSYGGQVWQALLISTDQIPPSGSAFNTYWELLSDYPPWMNNVTYQPGQTVSWAGEIWIAVATAAPGIAPGTNSAVWNLFTKYYPQPTLYSGDEAQTPDPTIQAAEGVPRTSAMRGLCYAVWTDFPLANFGNRIPNVRAEVTFNDYNGPIIAQQSYSQLLEYLGAGGTLEVSLGQIFTTDFLIVVVRSRPSSFGGFGGGVDNMSITDSAGNTWTLFASGDNKAIYVCAAPKAVGSLNITCAAGNYNRDMYAICVRGWTSYSLGTAASGTGSPMTVTNGAFSISLNQGPGPAAWLAAMFVFTDAFGHNLEIAPFFTDDEFAPDPTLAGPIIIPTGYLNLFPEGQPTWSAIFYNAPATAYLASVLQDICERAGLTLSDLDTSLINSTNVFPTDQVYGYVVRENRTAAEIIRALTAAYFFDAVESMGLLRFVPRGLPSAMTIPESDLGLLEELTKLNPSQISQEQDLPFRVTTIYEDPTLDYQQGKQEKQRSTRVVTTTNQQTVNAALVLPPDMARQVSEKALYLAWLERDSFQFSPIGAKYLVLDAADVITFIYETAPFVMRITEEQLGQGFVAQLKGVTENAGLLQSTATGPTPQSSGNPGGGSPEPLVGGVILWLLDIPLLADTDDDPGSTGFYWAVGTSQVDFLGATLQDSTDDTNFADLAVAGSLIDFGYTTTLLADPTAPFTPGSVLWDTTNTVTVKMTSGTLASASDEDVLNGANLLIVGQEILQFANATLNSDGTYTLSRLLRGRRGTEWACGFWGDFSNSTNTHAVGDVVIVVASGVQRQPEPLSIIGATMYYRALQMGVDPSTITAEEFTDTGRDLFPYAPINAGGSFDSGGNAILTWTRRTRIGGDGWGNPIPGQPFPLSEDKELYSVDIKNLLDVVVRTINNLTTPTAVYTVAMMTADFGGPPPDFVFDVYQISGEVGRGFKGHGVVPGGSSPEVLPGSGEAYINGA